MGGGLGGLALVPSSGSSALLNFETRKAQILHYVRNPPMANYLYIRHLLRALVIALISVLMSHIGGSTMEDCTCMRK